MNSAEFRYCDQDLILEGLPQLSASTRAIAQFTQPMGTDTAEMKLARVLPVSSINVRGSIRFRQPGRRSDWPPARSARRPVPTMHASKALCDPLAIAFLFAGGAPPRPPDAGPYRFAVQPMVRHVSASHAQMETSRWKGSSSDGWLRCSPARLLKLGSCSRGSLVKIVTQDREGDTIEVGGLALRFRAWRLPRATSRVAPRQPKLCVPSCSVAAYAASSAVIARTTGAWQSRYLQAEDIAEVMVRQGPCSRLSNGRYRSAEIQDGGNIGKNHVLPEYCRLR